MEDKDINPSPLDCLKILIYVELIGSKTPICKSYFDQILKFLNDSFDELNVINEETPPRRVFFNFINELNESKLAWGEFQYFRRPIALIGFYFRTENSNSDKLEVEEQQNILHEFDLFSKTIGANISSLLESRFIMFDINDGDSGTSKTNNFGAKNFLHFDVRQISPEYLDNFNQDMIDFLNGLFWILEGKRRNSSAFDCQSGDNLPLCPMVPDEEKFFVGLDKNSRLFRKRCTGRLKMQLAHLTLQAGLPLNALDIFSSAIEILKSSNDFLWLAGAYEGYVSALLIIRYCKRKPNRRISIDRPIDQSQLANGGLRRVATFSSPAMEFDKKCFPVSNANSNSNKITRTKSSICDIESATKLDDSQAENLVPPNRKLLPSSSEHRNGSLSPQRSNYQSKVLNLTNSRQKFYSGLRIEDLEEKIKLSLENYRKFSIAAGVECECALRLAMLYIEEKDYLQLDLFLRENCCTRFLTEDCRQFDDLRKAQICLLVAFTYMRVGFERKASFYLRLSAVFHFNVGNSSGVPMSKSDYCLIYPTLLNSMDSYLNPCRDMHKACSKKLTCPQGWPAVRIRAFHELFVAAQRAQYFDAAVRHLVHFIHSSIQYLNVQLLEQLCNELLTMTQEKIHRADLPLNVTKRIILPPISLINLPKILLFDVLPLPAYLTPKSVENDDLDSIFIYTPLTNLSEIDHRPLWVADCAGAVEITLVNLLPMELRIRNLMARCEGVPFEAIPTEIILPPFNETSAKLIITPKSDGVLTITGYTCDVMNVATVCDLRDIEWLSSEEKRAHKESPSSSKRFRKNDYKVRVVEHLPELSFDFSSLPRIRDFSVEFHSTEVYATEIELCAGQSTSYDITIMNKSDMDIDEVSCEVSGLIVSGGPNLVEIIQDSASNDQSFLRKISLNNSNGLSHQEKVRLSTRVNGVDPLAIIDSTKDDTEILNKEEILKSIPYTGRVLAASLNFTYVAGKSTACKYRRMCSLTLNVTIVPVVVVVDWNVLPGESPYNRYLSLDMINASESEVEITYMSGKTAFIQSKDVCRIPILCECFKYEKMSVNDAPMARGPMFRQYVQSTYQKFLRNHLCSQLDVRWKKSGSSECGLVPLGYLIRCLSLRDDLFMSPITANFEINGQQYENLTDFSAGIGETNTMRLKLNWSQNDLLLSGQINISCFQDLQNGSRVAADEVLWIGAKEFSFNMNKIDNQFDCGFQFLFMSEGLYRIESHLNRREVVHSNLSDSNVDFPFCFPLLPIFSFNVS